MTNHRLKEQQRDIDIAYQIAHSDLSRWVSKRQKTSLPLPDELIAPFEKCNWRPLHINATEKEIRFTIKLHLTYEGQKGAQARQQALEDIPKIEKELRDRWSMKITDGIYDGRTFRLEPIVEYHEWGSSRNLDYWHIIVRKKPGGDSRTNPVDNGGTMSINPDHVKNGWLIAAHELSHLFDLPDQYWLQKSVAPTGKVTTELTYASRYDTKATKRIEQAQELAKDHRLSPDHADLLGFLWPNDPKISMDRIQRVLQKKNPKPFLEDLYFLFYLHDVPQKEKFRQMQILHGRVKKPGHAALEMKEGYGDELDESQADLQNRLASVVPDLSERIRILEDSEQPQADLQNRLASVVPDLSERIRILEDSEQPQADLQNRLASVVPDLSERIKILEDSEQPQADLQNRLASVVPDLSKKIKILEDSDEQPEVDWQPFSGESTSERFGADRLRDFQEEQESFQPFSGETFRDKVDVARLTDSQEEQELFQPFPGQSTSERFGADRLRDFQEEPEPFQRFTDQSPSERFGADRLTDVLGHEEPFQRFTDQSPSERFGADRLTGFPRHQEPFQRFTDQSPSERFGADRLTDFPGQEPFKPFADQPQWMKQGFGGPPQIGSQVDLRPQQPFADKPQWKK